VDALAKEKSALALEKASLSRANKFFKKQVDLQLVLKFEHQEKMTEFGLQVKQVALEQTILKWKHSEDKSRVELLAKKEKISNLELPTTGDPERERGEEEGGHKRQEGEESGRPPPDCFVGHAPKQTGSMGALSPVLGLRCSR
jgi:hypothetical protein